MYRRAHAGLPITHLHRGRGEEEDEETKREKTREGFDQFDFVASTDWVKLVKLLWAPFPPSPPSLFLRSRDGCGMKRRMEGIDCFAWARRVSRKESRSKGGRPVVGRLKWHSVRPLSRQDG